MVTEESYRELEDTNNQLRRKLEEQNKANANLRAEIQSLKDKQNEMQFKMDELTDELQSAKTNVTLAQQDFKAAQHEMQVRQLIIERQEGEIDGLKFAIDHFSKRG